MSLTKANRSRQLRVTEDGSSTLFDPVAAETYHSGRGALTESRHVFLEGSGIVALLRRGATVHLLEVGLGTGLNLLLTLDAALAAGARLHYRALEADPPHPDLIAALDLGAHLARPGLADAWLEIARELHQRTASAQAGRSAAESRQLGFDLPGPPGADGLLEVTLGDAASAALAPGWAQAIYHDAFSMRASPRLWSAAFLAACAEGLAPGGAWVSYSVAGEVRRRLAAAGLTVEKRPGPPGGKRQMLWAGKPAARS